MKSFNLVQFFHIKEQVLALFRQSDPAPLPYTANVFSNLSYYTMQQGKNVLTVTKELHNHKIPFKWKYPNSLLITYGTTIKVFTLDEGLQFHRQRGILLGTSFPASPNHLSAKLQVVSYRKSPRRPLGDGHQTLLMLLLDPIQLVRAWSS